MTRQQESGFSAIELLITLFVLAAFLIAGVQLYNVVINGGGASRSESRAANLAYNYLRQSSNAASSPCTESTLVDGESVNVQGLIDVSVTVAVTCPHGITSEISKVEASVSYNNPSETVTYATFVIGQNGDESSVTDSLVGWWRFNGNANDYVTSASGTVSGASLTTGQNGQANGAYSFDGINDYIELSPSITNFGGFSISVWARGVSGPAATDGYGYIVHRGPSNLLGSSVYWIATDTSPALYRGDISGNVSSDTATAPGASTWRLLTLTYDGTTRNVYVDGDLQATDARALTNATTGTRLGIGGTPHSATYRPFQGEIDDVRFYNKTLSQSEVQALFSEGAF
jgi:Tfp pilus assembly protein PilV